MDRLPSQGEVKQSSTTYSVLKYLKIVFLENVMNGGGGKCAAFSLDSRGKRKSIKLSERLSFLSWYRSYEQYSK